MKKRKLIVLMIMAIITVLCFTACSSTEAVTLEKYCQDNPDVQESIDEAIGESNVNVEIKGNEIVYTLDLSTVDGYTEELVKSDDVVAAIEDALGAASETFGNIAKTIEETTEITGIQTTVNYCWGDEVIVTKTFTSADAASNDDN